MKNRFYTGGGFGLQFGDVTIVNPSPLIGYKVNEKVNTGLVVNYLYLRDNINTYTTNIYGGSAFLNYAILPPGYLILEYNAVNVPTFGISNDRKWLSGLLFGAGYRQMVGSFSFLNLEVLWNVIENPLYPRSNPIIRGGIGIGL